MHLTSLQQLNYLTDSGMAWCLGLYRVAEVGKNPARLVVLKDRSYEILESQFVVASIDVSVD